jgi:hypothetical protein
MTLANRLWLESGEQKETEETESLLSVGPDSVGFQLRNQMVVGAV